MIRPLQIDSPNHYSQRNTHPQARTPKSPRRGVQEPAHPCKEEKLPERKQRQNDLCPALETNRHGIHTMLFIIQNILERIDTLVNRRPYRTAKIKTDQRHDRRRLMFVDRQRNRIYTHGRAADEGTASHGQTQDHGREMENTLGIRVEGRQRQRRQRVEQTRGRKPRQDGEPEGGIHPDDQRSVERGDGLSGQGPVLRSSDVAVDVPVCEVVEGDHRAPEEDCGDEEFGFNGEELV